MPEIHDLRSFINCLESAGQLVRIKQPVDLEYELADVAAALERRRRPAPLFEVVNGSKWPIFSSAVASQTRAALALGCERSKVVEVMRHALEPANGIPPVRIEEAADAAGAADAARVAWKANVVTGDEIDVRKLPIPTHAVGDGGPFITAGVIISKDPISGRGNLSYNRMQVKNARQFGFNVNEWRHVREFLDVQEAKDEPLEVAVAIGLDPAIMIAAGARYPDDELRIAGAIRGEGIPVARGVTVDIDIPAEAELVIEGYLGAHERQAEGPLAEFHGYFGELWDSPVFHVTAVSWRDDPIFQTLIPGWNEHLYLGNVLPREPLLLNHVQYVARTVTGLHIPPYANGFTSIVAIDKCNPGEPKNVALAAFAAHVNIKWCIVVDPDVDIYDPADVMWALTTRVDWSRDVFFVPGAQGHEMDPTANGRGVHTKIGVDATAKKERRGYDERVRYGAIDLSQYLPAG
jgi:2,5-furandicarboxylate decarboxylase 1